MMELFSNFATPPQHNLAIVEVINGIGSGLSDPYTQASLTYRKFWAQESRMLTECVVPLYPGRF